MDGVGWESRAVKDVSPDKRRVGGLGRVCRIGGDDSEAGQRKDVKEGNSRIVEPGYDRPVNQ